MALSADWAWVSGLTMRSKVYLTASALKGVPSWNVTSSRSLKLYSVASSLTVHSVARPGTKTPGSLCHTSGSVMCSVMLPTRENVVTLGSRRSKPAGMPTMISVPIGRCRRCLTGCRLQLLPPAVASPAEGAAAGAVHADRLRPRTSSSAIKMVSRRAVNFLMRFLLIQRVANLAGTVATLRQCILRPA